MSGIEALLAQQIIGLNEAIDDRTASLLVAGTGISLSYNDGAGTLTIANTGLGGSTGSTDNRILRSDGTGGATVQASAVTIDDSGNISGVGTITASDVVSIPVNGTAASPALRVGTQVSGLTAGTNQLHFVVDGAVRAWADRNSLLQANGFQVNIPGGYFTINADVFSYRNATGPSWEIRAAGGLIVNNAAGSANAALDCGAITAPSIANGGAATSFASNGNVTMPSSAYIGSTNYLGWTNRALLNSTSDGVVQINNWAANALGSLVCGAITASGKISASGNGGDVIRWIRPGLCDFGLGDANGDSVRVYNNGAATDLLRIHGTTRIVTAYGAINVGTYTVATLPSASANAGALAQVTDSSVTTNGSTVAGGGSNRVIVFSNGTNWDVVVA